MLVSGHCLVSPYISKIIKRISWWHRTSYIVLRSLQDHVDSLAPVVFQNRCALDLLTAEKCGTCLFQDEECCFYTNKSGVVRDMAQQLRKHITKKETALYNKCFLQIHISTGSTDQIPALSQGILTSAYAWTLHPVLSESPGDHTG
jgi:hypothetical protein